MNVEQALRTLAADDAKADVPAHVDAAVMARWDALRRTELHRRTFYLWRVALLSAAAGVCVTLLIVWSTFRPLPDTRQASVATSTSAPVAFSAVPIVPDVVAEPQMPLAPARLIRRRERLSPAPEPGFVLVPEGGMVPSTLTIMRVRMPRTAFARLGMPIVNPEAEGMVDVEVLVGEDGVARSIRRAAAVGLSAEE